MNLPVNMALALFQKHLKRNRNIVERGIGKIRFFLIELPIELPIVLPIVLPIGIVIGGIGAEFPLFPFRASC